MTQTTTRTFSKAEEERVKAEKLAAGEAEEKPVSAINPLR